MAQPSVSVVIPVWNQWQFTKACLETLRPTLGVRDEVIVVDNGSEDQTHNGLKRTPGIKVITNEANRGFATACNQGAAEAKGDVVVFLNNDTLLAARWLDQLISPFEDPAVAATGPRSNFVSGPQLVEQPNYALGSMTELRRFAKEWQQENKGQFTETTRLVGFCLAVRRSAFEAIEGFDEGFGIGGCEDDDLCMRLVNNGGKLLICHGSYVHHHGHATFDANGLNWFEIQQQNMGRLVSKHGGAAPVVAAHQQHQQSGALLSACMIVKDEADLLSECLSSLNGLVDEVIVYDTGSTDNTKELAHQAGATVIDGYWDDDFGRARNAALEACNGEWVLHIDADEVFEGEAQQVRTMLMQAHASAFQVEILNLSGDGRNDLTHRPCRIFKRTQYHWSGRLHEQVVLRNGQDRTNVEIAYGCRLIHSGYMPEQIEAKKKGERNIRIAQADADADDNRDPVDKLTNLARSYTLTGQHEEALSLCTQARSMPTKSQVARRTLLRAGAQACLAVGRPDEAIEWADEFDAESKSKDTGRYFRGMALADLGHWEEALQQLEGLDNMKDDDGVAFPQHIVNIRRAQAYGALGDWGKAADEVAAIDVTGDITEPIWALAAESYWRTGRDIKPLLNNVPHDRLNEIFGQLRAAPAEAADKVLDILYDDPSFHTSILAMAIRIGPHLPCDRALEWSFRLRKVGLSDDDPLITKAWDANQPPQERVRAAVLAKGAFADERADNALKFAAPLVDEEAFAPVLYEIGEIVPAYLEPFVIAAANLPERSFAMGRALHGLGAEEEGVAVLVHGFDKPGVDSKLVTDAAEWLESVGAASEAKALRNIKA